MQAAGITHPARLVSEALFSRKPSWVSPPLSFTCDFLSKQLTSIGAQKMITLPSLTIAPFICHLLCLYWACFNCPLLPGGIGLSPLPALSPSRPTPFIRAGIGSLLTHWNVSLKFPIMFKITWKAVWETVNPQKMEIYWFNHFNQVLHVRVGIENQGHWPPDVWSS